jgi:hypothetical protein
VRPVFPLPVHATCPWEAGDCCRTPGSAHAGSLLGSRVRVPTQTVYEALRRLASQCEFLSQPTTRHAWSELVALFCISAQSTPSVYQQDTGTTGRFVAVVQLGGLEPPTSCSTDRRSNQLSYNCILCRPQKGVANGAETRCNAALWQGREMTILVSSPRARATSSMPRRQEKARARRPGFLARERLPITRPA